MLAFPSNPSTASSHHALVDSGASIHILTCHTFLSDAVVNHSAVASFAGSTSRATHKGTFAALVQCTNNRFHRLVQKNSALVVPDASRMLFSISQALAAGHHVHFGNSPGLLLKDTKAFIPFVRDSTHAAKWQIACDEEMESLRNLNCWQVVPLSSVPPGTPIMGSRWTFKAKTDQHGEITRLRARFVCQGVFNLIA